MAIVLVAGLVAALVRSQNESLPQAGGDVELSAATPDRPLGQSEQSVQTAVATAPIPTVVPVTTTTVPVVATTVPRPAPTPGAATPSSPPAAPSSSAGPTEPDCAILPSDVSRDSLRGGQWLGLVASGSTAHYEVSIMALPCDLYDGEGGQITINLNGPQATSDITVDYGDGTSSRQGPFDPCKSPMPVQIPGTGRPKVYARPGTYTVKVTITLIPCAAPQSTETITLTVPVVRHFGARPYPAPEIIRV